VGDLSRKLFVGDLWRKLFVGDLSRKLFVGDLSRKLFVSDLSRKLFVGDLLRKLFVGDLSIKFKFHSNLTIITGTLQEAQYTFLIISRSFLLKTRNVSDKSCRENQITHFMFLNVFFSKIVPFMR
jgi:hypothetical protein